MIRSASGYGSGRRRTALTILKIAVFAPMPSASVMIATAPNAGFLINCRKASRRLLITKGDNRIDASGSARWYQTSEQGSDGQSCGGNGNQKRIVWRYLVKLSRHE